MCMMDWRIGRLINWNLIGTSSSSVIIKPNRQRVALQITPGENSAFGVADSLTVLDVTSGVAFYCREYPTAVKLFTLAEYGSIIQRTLNIENGAGNDAFVVWEAVLPESYLAAGLEQFESEYARVHN